MFETLISGVFGALFRLTAVFYSPTFQDSVAVRLKKADDRYALVLPLNEFSSETQSLLLQGQSDVPANFHVATEWGPVEACETRI